MSCIFCRIVAGELPSSRFFEDDRLIGFMDIHPWRPGHLLIAPRAHHQRLGELASGDVSALFALGVRAAAALRAGAVPCDDVHFVVNDGPAASQSVPHVHLHVVPRVRGDRFRILGRGLLHPVAALRSAPRARLDAEAAAIRARLES